MNFLMTILTILSLLTTHSECFRFCHNCFKLHIQEWGKAARDVAIIVVLPMERDVGPVRLDYNEIQLASHLALDRIHKEKLLDPMFYKFRCWPLE